MPVRRVLPVLAFAALASMAAAADSTYLITEVEINGAQNVHPDRVRFIVDARPGKSYTQEQLNQAIADDVRAIEKMGPFKNAKAERIFNADGTGVKIVYSFEELAYVGEVRFETINRVVRRGTKWRPAPPAAADAEFDELGYFDRDKLKKIVVTKAGSYLNPVLVENDRRQLENKLQTDGHRNAKVTIETPTHNGTTTVIFRIDEGQQVEVGKVIIQGLPEGVSWRVFEPGVYNPGGLFNAEGKAYQADMVALDEGSIVRTLQDLGWLDARLISTRREVTDYVRPLDERRRNGPDLAPDGEYNDRIVLIYTVEAGARYRLGKVDFVGNTVASSAELREAFGMPEGAWFKRLDLYGDPREERRARARDKALGAIERARRVISNQGYAQATLGTDRRIDVVNHIVDLTMHASEGRKYKIGRVDLLGNVVTRDAVIRRGIALNPGDRWNDDQLDESRRQIERTGIFAGRSSQPRPLKLEQKFPEDRPGEVDLEVQLDEKPTGSLRFELGYSSASGVFGSVGYSENNFDLMGVLSGNSYRGAGQILSFDVYASQERRSVSTSWTNPHLLDGPFELTLSGYRSDGTPYEWSELRLGGGASLGRRFLQNDLAIGMSYGYFDLGIQDVSDNASNEALAANNKGFYENSLGLYQVWDRLNDRQLPTSGYTLKANETSFGFPLPGSAEYTELSFTADNYLPLYEGDDGGVTFFRLAARYKQLDVSGSTQKVPFYARYRGGGQAPRHRGFADYDLSPKEVNVNGVEAYTGGTKDALITAEMSFPVMGTNDGIRLVGFADYGNVWGEDQSVSLADMRTAVGFGVRFPISLPVSLDFAWLLDPKPGESNSQVHFGLGVSRF